MIKQWGRWIWGGVLCLGLSAFLVGSLWAQERSGGRGRWRGRGDMPDDPAAQLRFRVERAERMIGLFDVNQDGVIEPNEVRGQSRYIYERMAKEAGLDPSHSIAVGEFRTAVIRHIQQSAEQAKTSPGSPPSGGPGGPSSPSGGGGPGSSPSGGAGGPSSTPSGLRGFGTTAPNPSKPLGFGSPSSGNPAPAQGIGPSGGAPSSESAGLGNRDRQELEQRVRQYAQSLFRQYDANKNGVLEREEWQQMRGSPEKADRNRDGVITLEELTVRELERNQIAVSGSPPSSGSSSGQVSGTTSTSSGSASPSSSVSGSSPSFSRSGGTVFSRSSSSGGATASRSASPGRVRFLTPLERLPKGIPDWFIQKDSDGDGQVSMAEYASEWSDAKAAEFQKYDLNNDGIITPEECLRAEKSK